ncbi:MAG: hypothetical protein N2Z65_05725 [Clostridiales bacterium]|nr:hypothetical protein [Clostridiales bacterium]
MRETIPAKSPQPDALFKNPWYIIINPIKSPAKKAIIVNFSLKKAKQEVIIPIRKEKHKNAAMFSVLISCPKTALTPTKSKIKEIRNAKKPEVK